MSGIKCDKGTRPDLDGCPRSQATSGGEEERHERRPHLRRGGEEGGKERRGKESLIFNVEVLESDSSGNRVTKV